MPVSCPMVLLCHVLPDGSEHFDWLLARDEAGTQPLRSFRTSVRVDQLSPGESADLESAADHRPVYLRYEGAIAAAGGGQPKVDRGVVHRVAEGLWTGIPHDSAGEVWAVRWFDQSPCRLAVLGVDGALWRVRRIPDRC